MAGLAPISLQQRCGIDGKPFPGAKAYFYRADTSAPIIVYQDYGLGTPHPNPVEAGAYGIFPAIYIDEAVAFYRMRVTTADGVAIGDEVILPVYGPGDGGGGGAEVPVDPNALIKSGYVLWQPRTGALPGYVRLNGRSIGSALSGATERANQDCEALYLHNWSAYPDAYFPVTGGRGANAAADWAAGKPMTMYDAAGLMPAGLDNMGNGAKGVIDASLIALGNGSTPFAKGGDDLITLTEAQLPSHYHEVFLHDPEHDHQYTPPRSFPGASGGAGAAPGDPARTGKSPTGITIRDAPGGAGNQNRTKTAGGGVAHPNMPPFMLGTYYQKL